jgi:hypothetical protein
VSVAFNRGITVDLSLVLVCAGMLFGAPLLILLLMLWLMWLEPFFFGRRRLY